MSVRVRLARTRVHVQPEAAGADGVRLGPVAAPLENGAGEVDRVAAGIGRDDEALQLVMVIGPPVLDPSIPEYDRRFVTLSRQYCFQKDGER